MTDASSTTPSRPKPNPTRSFLAFVMVGAAIMAAVDVIAFHQLLAWHHFYDRSTSTVALASDGLLHAVEIVVIVAGLFLYADLRRRDEVAGRWAWSGLFIGLGGFQLFDGLVDHKVLRLHQIRYDVDLLPYDLAWNAGAVLLLIIGVLLLIRARQGSQPAPASPRS